MELKDVPYSVCGRSATLFSVGIHSNFALNRQFCLSFSSHWNVSEADIHRAADVFRQQPRALQIQQLIHGARELNPVHFSMITNMFKEATKKVVVPGECKGSTTKAMNSRVLIIKQECPAISTCIEFVHVCAVPLP